MLPIIDLSLWLADRAPAPSRSDGAGFGDRTVAEQFSIDLQALRVFLAVAACGNMTQAARGLGMTQSAVSQIIGGLERGFGARLIDRGHRPLTLTAAGNALQHKAVALINDAALLPAAVRQAGISGLPEIRLGMVDTFAATAGPGVIKVLMASAHRLAIWSGLAPQLGQALLNRQVDLIVSSDGLDDVDGLERVPLWREPFVLVVPASYPDDPHLLSLEGLAATAPLIRFSARSDLGAQIERHLRRSRVMADRRLEIDSSDAVVPMVAAGIGWSMLTPLCLLQAQASARGIRVLPMPSPRATRTLMLLRRTGEFPELAPHTAKVACDVMRRECLSSFR